MTTTSVRFRTDRDGFLSQECPTCLRRFKAKFEKGSTNVLSHCPYCNHVGHNCWWTTEQVEFLSASVNKAVVEPMLKDFARDMRRLNRPNSVVRFEMDVAERATPRAPVERDTGLDTIDFACCQETIKHDGRSKILHCVICGKQSPA